MALRELKIKFIYLQKLLLLKSNKSKCDSYCEEKGNTECSKHSVGRYSAFWIYSYFLHITFEVLNNHKAKSWVWGLWKADLKYLRENLPCRFLFCTLTFLLLFPSSVLLFFLLTLFHFSSNFLVSSFFFAPIFDMSWLFLSPSWFFHCFFIFSLFFCLFCWL